MHHRLHDPDIQDQVEDILAGMDLPQKIGQMTQADRQTCTPEQASQYQIGSILSAAGSHPGENRVNDWVESNQAYWQASMQPSHGRPTIPIMCALDAIHGNNNVRGATVFPHNIALGAAGDATLNRRIGEVTATEVLATGIDWALAPNLAVARDYHWGRTYESFSEHPDTVAHLAVPVLEALQQDYFGESLLGCVKHWVGDGGTSYGIDQGNTRLSWKALQTLHITPYIPALKAGAMTVMASFSSWNGEKCHGSHFLLTEVLKQKLGFAGFIVSDFQGIDYLSDDFYLAVEKGVNAGIDLFMVPESWQTFIEYLQSHVELGTVDVSRIDDAVRRILRVKMAAGMFEKAAPKQRLSVQKAKFGCQAHRDIAREAVRKSLVLLKNDQDILPFSSRTRLLVTGKSAHNLGHQCGGFTLDWQGVSGNDQIEGGTSIWQGVQVRCANATLVEDIEQVEVSGHYDAALVVIGETPYAEGLGDIRDGENLIVEAGSQIKGQLNLLEPYGTTLDHEKLFPEDYAAIKTLQSAGIPVVVLLVSGRPLVMNNIIDDAEALVAAWLPGSEGDGVAQVLFGEYDFSGRLAFTWPDKTHPPVHVGDDNYNPRFPFGYGLSYAQSGEDRPRKAG